MPGSWRAGDRDNQGHDRAVAVVKGRQSVGVVGNPEWARGRSKRDSPRIFQVRVLHRGLACQIGDEWGDDIGILLRIGADSGRAVDRDCDNRGGCEMSSYAVHAVCPPVEWSVCADERSRRRFA